MDFSFQDSFSSFRRKILCSIIWVIWAWTIWVDYDCKNMKNFFCHTKKTPKFIFFSFIHVETRLGASLQF